MPDSNPRLFSINRALDFLMDASISKAPLVPCIFGYHVESLQGMEYVAVLSHKNSMATALSQSEIPIMTLEASQLLWDANMQDTRHWFPITRAHSPEAAMDRLKTRARFAAEHVDLSLYRAVVWNTTYLLGTAMLEKSFQELKPIFKLPSLEAIQELQLENMLDKMRDATNLYQVNKEDQQ